MSSTLARVAAGFLVVVLASVAYRMWTSGKSGKTGDFPDGIRMVCTDAECGTVFFTNIAEIARIREDDDAAPIPCTKCGGPGVRGHLCPSCGGTFPETQARSLSGEPACPLCEEPLPKLTGGG